MFFFFFNLIYRNQSSKWPLFFRDDLNSTEIGLNRNGSKYVKLFFYITSKPNVCGNTLNVFVSWGYADEKMQCIGLTMESKIQHLINANILHGQLISAKCLYILNGVVRHHSIHIQVLTQSLTAVRCYCVKY